MNVKELKYKATLRFFLGAWVFEAIFFWTAGTFQYWEAWLFLATIFIPMILAVRYFLKNDPALLERRLRRREVRTQQKILAAVGMIFWIPVVVIPGLDRRFGWTDVPVPIVLLAHILILLSYYFVFLTLKENSFAASTIRVEEGQKVVTTGPYALVRHPMYLGSGVMFLAIPLALGSYLALIPALFTPIFLVLRILDEEKVLLLELPGYQEYTQKTQYRLIPRVW
jgi:protein-S-isoprenylcysteine O-methyltransferase Ste14